jgi:hypothetical protein
MLPLIEDCGPLPFNDCSLGVAHEGPTHNINTNNNDNNNNNNNNDDNNNNNNNNYNNNNNNNKKYIYIT